MLNRKTTKQVTRSSGNVFVDLGLPNAEVEKTKVRLAFEIIQIIENRRLSQIAAARQLNINQPKILALSNYRIDAFSVERLMNFLTALDRDVDIVIRSKPKSKRGGRILVIAA